MSTTAGYHATLAYPGVFHRELTPTWLHATTTALGHGAPDLRGPYTWCELGCGPGLSTLIAAATHPQGRFIAVDFDAKAIARGQALAEASGIGNVAFMLASFAELAEAAPEVLPPLDFIVLHGVLSWLSPGNRQAVLRVIERWLKPGGIACLAYMSQPGSAPMMAMQRVLKRSAEISPSPTGGLNDGFSLLQALRDGGAGQFVVVPDMKAQLTQASRQPPGYLAHEFLGEHWDPLHAADIIAAMERAGMGFLGSATPLENIDAVSLPAATLGTISGIGDTALRETAKDIARNQSLRRDLYQRDPTRLSPSDHRAALMRQRFIALPGAPTDGMLRFETRIGPVDGPTEMFAPLLRELARGQPVAFSELLALPAYAGRGGLLNQALQMLTWAGYVHPEQPVPDIAAARALNQAILQATMAGDDYDTLAAPAIGSGLPASRTAMLAAQALSADPSLRGPTLLRAVRALASDGVDEKLLADFELRLRPGWQRLGMLPHFSTASPPS